MAPIIKVGFCVSYDWELLKNSIPPIYELADIVCLAIDKNRKSWSRNHYKFNEQDFYQFIKSIDRDKKIDIYEDDFSISTLNSRENCNRHRTLIAERMGKGGWHIQIDSDEYFLNFESFKNHLLSINSNPTGDEKPINVCANLLPIYKRVENGYLLIDFQKKAIENAPFATNVPLYERARNNGHFNNISSNFVIHETWARDEDQLWFKLKNWGHASEELDALEYKESYFALWKSINEYNYQHIKNINPAKNEIWPGLMFVKAKSINELIDKLESDIPQTGNLSLKIKNSRNVARLKSIYNKLKK